MCAGCHVATLLCVPAKMCDRRMSECCGGACKAKDVWEMLVLGVVYASGMMADAEAEGGVTGCAGSWSEPLFAVLSCTD